MERKNASKKRAYALRSSKVLTFEASFKNVKRITILAAVHDNGESARPMFVFHGSKLRLRSYVRRIGGTEQTKCIADCLPRHALITTKKTMSSVESKNFMEWTSRLVRDTADLRQNGRKMLLTYDGYRSHLSLPVLEMLRENGIIGYALPSNTSGTTRPLDLTVFPVLKNRFRNVVQEVARGVLIERTLDEFDVCKVVTKAYEYAFTAETIKSGFRLSGIWPLDEYRLFQQTRPYSESQLSGIASLDEMISMLEARRQKTAAEIIGDVILTSTGFLDTSEGAVMSKQRSSKKSKTL